MRWGSHGRCGFRQMADSEAARWHVRGLRRTTDGRPAVDRLAHGADAGVDAHVLAGGLGAVSPIAAGLRPRAHVLCRYTSEVKHAGVGRRRVLRDIAGSRIGGVDGGDGLGCGVNSGNVDRRHVACVGVCEDTVRVRIHTVRPARWRGARARPGYARVCKPRHGPLSTRRGRLRACVVVRGGARGNRVG